MKLDKYIKKLRIEKGLTQEELGKILGVTKSTVQKWESGYISNMKRDKITLLSKILHISPFQLLDIEVTPTINSLTEKEQNLIEQYRKLNEKGQDKIIDICDDLLQLNKYKKS